MNVARYAARRVQPQACALFLCDMQDRFASLIHAFPAVVATSEKMLRAAAILNLPVIATEQYPKALGMSL